MPRAFTSKLQPQQSPFGRLATPVRQAQNQKRMKARQANKPSSRNQASGIKQQVARAEWIGTASARTPCRPNSTRPPRSHHPSPSLTQSPPLPESPEKLQIVAVSLLASCGYGNVSLPSGATVSAAASSSALCPASVFCELAGARWACLWLRMHDVYHASTRSPLLRSYLSHARRQTCHRLHGNRFSV